MLLRDMTLGRPVHSAAGHGFTVADVAYAPDAEMAPHAHERTYLSFVLRGSFVEEAGTARDVARSTTVVIMPAGATHRNRIGPSGARSLVIGIDEDFGRRAGFIAERRRWIDRGAPIQLLARAYRAHRLGETDTIEELLFAFADAVRGTPDDVREPLASIERILRETFVNPLTVTEMARAVDRDPAYLCRAFRKQAGCTMGEYLRQVRAKKAADLIASTDTPLAEVASACGFADQSHLTRVFKAQVSMTPHEFRRFARQVNLIQDASARERAKSRA